MPSIPSSSTSSEGPPSSFFSTLSSLPSSASSWSATLRGGQRPPLRAEATDDVDVDLVVSRLVYRAGEDDLYVSLPPELFWEYAADLRERLAGDGRGRPIVCFAPSLLPDPAMVPHDLLLDKITAIFSQYGSSLSISSICLSSGTAKLTSLGGDWGCWAECSAGRLCPHRLCCRRTPLP